MSDPRSHAARSATSSKTVAAGFLGVGVHEGFFATASLVCLGFVGVLHGRFDRLGRDHVAEPDTGRVAAMIVLVGSGFVATVGG
jgi:hypothetical protein